VSPETAGQLAEVAEYAVAACAGAYLWLVGRGAVRAPGQWAPSDRQRWWLRAAGILGFGCGAALVFIACVRLAVG
jgi:hypothetical protein